MRFRWRRRAAADLAHVRAYLQERSPRAAKTVTSRIRERVNGLASFPESCPLIGVGMLRKLVVSRTPYVVYYEIVGREIWIIALFHASQDRPWLEFSSKVGDA